MRNKTFTPLYVFDTAHRAREERKLSALRGGGLVWGAWFVTSEQLIHRLWDDLAETQTVLSYAGRYALVSQAVREAKRDGAFSFFSAQAEMPGFLRHALGFLQELKQARVSSQEFSSRVTADGFLKNFTSQDLCEKYVELSEIHSRYEEKKKKLSLLDEYDREENVTQFLRGSSRHPSLFFLNAFTHVCLVDLMDVSALRFEFLHALMQFFKDAGKHTSVVFPYDPDKPLLFRFLEKDLQQLESTGEERDVVAEHFWSVKGREKQDAVRFFLEKFAAEEKFYEIQGARKERERKGAIEKANVHVFCVEGEYRELEEVARRVRNLLDAGAPPCEIGVLFRDLKPYEKLVQEIFSRFSIPLTFRRGMPLLLSPLARALLLLLRLARDNFQRDDLLSFLRSSYFVFQDDLCRELDDALCRCGLFSGNKQEWKRALLVLSQQLRLQAEEAGGGRREAGESEKPKQIELLSEKCFKLLSSFDALIKAKTFHSFFAAYEKVIRKFRVEEALNDVRDAALLKRDRECYAAFINALSFLKTLFQNFDGRGTLHEFYGVLVESLSRDDMASASFDGGVNALNIDDAVGFRFSYVFLPALTENVFPKKQYENPLLKSEERLLLRRELKRHASFRTLSEKYLEDPLLFYLSLHCAEKEVFLSYSTMDFHGRSMVRSRFVDEVLETFQSAESPFALDENLTPVDEKGELVPVPFVDAAEFQRETVFLTRDEYLSYLTTSIFRLREKKEHFPLGLDAILREKQHPFRAGVLRLVSLIKTEKERGRFYQEENRKKRTEEGVAGPYAGRFLDADAKKFVSEKFSRGYPVSASFLEAYGTCPFLFFGKYVLRIHEMEETELEVSPLTEWRFLHDVLHEFFRAFPRLKGNAGEEEALLHLFDARWEEWKKKAYLGSESLQIAKYAALKKALRRFYAHESARAEGWQWAKDSLEKEMRRTFAVDGMDISFYGRADKIEFCQEGDAVCLRVVDFKSGKDAKSGANGEKARAEAAGILSFQLPLYGLLAAEEWEEKTNKKVALVQAEYRAIRADKKPAFAAPFSDKKPDGKRGRIPVNLMEDSRKQNFLKQTAEQMTRIRDGCFDVTPYSYEVSCAFCAYKAVCRYENVLESPTKENENET